MRKILAHLRRAVSDYGMIQNGDKIAVGVSGGKDSLVLLAALKNLSLFLDEKFEVEAITVDLGFKDTDFSALRNYIENDLKVKYTVVPSDLYQIIFVDRKEKNPCSLCSKMRRGILNTELIKNGCNKLALGHHLDDVIETFFLSLFYESRLNTFKPVSFMSRTGVTMIRPLIYIEEKDISAYSRKKNLPVLHNPCPVNHHTQREFIKNHIKSLQKEMPFVKERIFGAISHPERNSLWDLSLPEKAKTELLQDCGTDFIENAFD